MTPSGRPLTKRTMSGRRRCLLSVTVNWLTARKSLLVGVTKSMGYARVLRIEPVGVRYSTRNAVDQHAVEGAVCGLRGWGPGGVGEFADGVFEGGGGEGGVEVVEGAPEALSQYDLGVVSSFDHRALWPDIGAMGDVPAKSAKPSEGALLNDRLGDARRDHCVSSSTGAVRWSTGSNCPPDFALEQPFVEAQVCRSRSAKYGHRSFLRPRQHQR